MASLKEIFERAQQTGQVEYTIFGGGTNITPFNQTSLPFTEGTDKKLNSKSPYIRLGYEGGFPGDAQFRTDDPTNTYNTLLATTRDTARIGAFFTDFPKGPLWLAKQTTLQLTNPDVSYKSVSDRTTLADKISQIEGPRFYNPLGTNTLASVAGNALGLHFTRHGLSPTNEIGYLSLNTSIQGGVDFVSRLTLYKEKLLGFSGNGSLTLNKYTSGPNSFYALGNTTITSYTDSFGLNTGETDKGAFYGNEDQQQYNGFNPWSYNEIKNYSDNVKNGTLTTYPGLGTENKFIQDFIENVNNPIMMSMFYRMLDTDKFIKFGKEIYSFTDEEKEKLEKIKPLFDNLVETISKIKNIEKGG